MTDIIDLNKYRRDLASISLAAKLKKDGHDDELINFVISKLKEIRASYQITESPMIEVDLPVDLGFERINIIEEQVKQGINAITGSAFEALNTLTLKLLIAELELFQIRNSLPKTR